MNTWDPFNLIQIKKGTRLLCNAVLKLDVNRRL